MEEPFNSDGVFIQPPGEDEFAWLEPQGKIRTLVEQWGETRTNDDGFAVILISVIVAISGLLEPF